MMRINRNNRKMMFKDVPCGKAFETENGVYMKCFYDEDKDTREYCGVRFDSGMLVLFPDTSEVRLLDMEVTEI